MSATIFTVKPSFNDDSVAYDNWQLVQIEETYEQLEKVCYLYFVYDTINGEHKRACYSSKTKMIYGVDDYDLTIDDLEILIKFINLELYKKEDFKDRIDNLETCILLPEYIYSEIFY